MRNKIHCEDDKKSLLPVMTPYSAWTLFVWVLEAGIHSFIHSFIPSYSFSLSLSPSQTQEEALNPIQFYTDNFMEGEIEKLLVHKNIICRTMVKSSPLFQLNQ